MRYLKSRSFEHLLEGMAVDSSLRMEGTEVAGKKTEIEGILTFAVYTGSRIDERRLAAANLSQMLRLKYFPLLVHITPRGRPIIVGKTIQVVDANGNDARWVDRLAVQSTDKSVRKVSVGFIACASA
jgi:hypothetical protein